jgi:hypothetical protein
MATQWKRGTTPRHDHRVGGEYVYQLSLEERLEAARKEYAWRVRCYPKWQREGKITPEQARRGLLEMKEIGLTLRDLCDREGRQPSMFHGKH